MTWTLVAVVIMIGSAIAGQHFAYRAGQHRAHADWCEWMAAGWLRYLATGDVTEAFGLGRPTPEDRALGRRR